MEKIKFFKTIKQKIYPFHVNQRIMYSTHVYDRKNAIYFANLFI